LNGQGGLIAPVPGISDPTGLTGPQVAWLRQGGELSQDTGIVLEEGDIYRLTIDIGDRTDQGWPGGEARLVDSNDVVLAVKSLDAPADGSWSTVTLETTAISGAQVSAGLRIE